MSSTNYSFLGPVGMPAAAGEPTLAGGWMLPAGYHLGKQTAVPVPPAWPLHAPAGDPVFQRVLGHLQQFYAELPDERRKHLGELIVAAESAAMKSYIAAYVDAATSPQMPDLLRQTSSAALRAALLFFVAELERSHADQGDDVAEALQRLQHEQSMRERAGGFVGPTEVHRLLGISRQTVLDRTKAFELMSVEDNGRRRYPLCQFGERHQVLAGLPAVLKTLAAEGITGWMALDVLLDDAPRYGRSPLTLLRDGRAADALAAAQAYATQGAA